ncbi:hypothetical protein EUX98_g2004 [Antrodiella citrinella]|uniref:Uncharacterized protein n=1 Tax=Antrodiella citrinella TaxID=2447956 RepID=A0A4S4N046_9APHY|nr:hypothetical protein EUX98_g2004 [Antrodiella citrinella]
MEATLTLEHLLGAFTVESCGAFILYGVFAMQAYSYFMLATRDPMLVKCVAWAVGFVETLQTCLLIQFLYHFMGTESIHGAQYVIWSAPVLVITEVSLSFQNTQNILTDWRRYQQRLIVLFVQG